MSAGRLEAVVCVVGAGAGGAVAAAELAEGGAKVVILDQGPAHSADDFSARPPEMLATLYRDGGQTTTVGRPPIGLPLGSGLGGTTLVNSGTCFRTPPHVLERWAREFGLDMDEESLRPSFERGEQALSVAEVTPELARPPPELVALEQRRRVDSARADDHSGRLHLEPPAAGEPRLDASGPTAANQDPAHVGARDDRRAGGLGARYVGDARVLLG